MRSIELIRGVLLLPLALLLAGSPGDPKAGRAEGGIIVLRAADDLGFTLDFRTGASGAVIEDGELRLDQALIVFERLAPGHLSIGFNAESGADLVELGSLLIPPVRTKDDVAPNLPLRAFFTLGATRGDFFYGIPGSRTVRLPEVSSLFAAYAPRGVRHFRPVVGEAFVLRLVPRLRQSEELAVKLLIVDHEPGRSVTLRWALL